MKTKYYFNGIKSDNVKQIFREQGRNRVSIASYVASVRVTRTEGGVFSALLGMKNGEIITGSVAISIAGALRETMAKVEANVYFFRKEFEYRLRKFSE